MDHSSILSDLKKKNYKPIYVLSGDEPYFIDLISDYIEKNVLDESEKEFNQTVLYGRDVDVNTIISEAKRYPMMSDKQVLIIKEAQNVKDIDDLASYAEHPLDSTLLVLCYKYKTLDGRKALKKVVTKKGVLFESEKLRDYKIPDWIAGYLKEKKYSAEPKALQMLTEFLGTDIGKIVNELEKLMINIPPGTEITPDHIQQNIGISKDFNTFELSDAISKRDVLKANRIVNYFAANSKEHPMPVTMGVLFGYFVKVMQFHFATDKSKDAVARLMGVHPFFVNDYVIAAKNYPLGKVRQVIGILREYDMRWKGVDNASADDGELLKEMVWKMIH
ncbi:MAG TPA: DNA polymerase III subunit delta [Bacteroidia bacterium]|jgi:DNA polymerase-3 subunit delta|nr:DNA polymerase III subunit delta [Bacteroidia bacterium]